MTPTRREARLPIFPNLAMIQEAQEFLGRYFGRTRLVAAPFLSQKTGKKVFLKLETELPTGSFKVRGALWALAARMHRERVGVVHGAGVGGEPPKKGTMYRASTRDGIKVLGAGVGGEPPKKGTIYRAAARDGIKEVVASSTGNHGAAVAYAAKEFGIAAKIFLPANCNPVKRGRIAALGATIVESGGSDPASVFELAAEYAKQPEVYFLNDGTDTDLPAGPGTITCEILEQLPETSAIVVPMGDTALIRGIAAAAKQITPQVKIIGVQAERAPSYCLSWKEGKVVGTESCDTIADGLATRTPEEANVRDVKSLVDDVVLVSEEEMLRAIETLLVEEHVLAEPAGAASTAALLKSNAGCGDCPVLIVSGANISREVLKKAIQGA